MSGKSVATVPTPIKSSNMGSSKVEPSSDRRSLVYSLNSLSVNELSEPARLLFALLLLLTLPQIFVVVVAIDAAVVPLILCLVIVAMEGSGPDDEGMLDIVIGGGRHSATKEATELAGDITSPLARDI